MMPKDAGINNIIRCSWIGCRVRKACARYVAPWIRADGQGFASFYADASFQPATGCEYFYPLMEAMDL